MKRLVVILILVTVMCGLCSVPVYAEEMTKAQKRHLFQTGAKLWPVYCAQCHNARPGSEFAPYQWDQIIMHMRGLANLPAEDAQAIVEYLKGGRE